MFNENDSAEKMWQVARMCHNINKAYCESIGDNTQKTWEGAPQWQKDSALKGVKAHLDSHLTMTPEGSHASWMKEKLDNGWSYGEVKDEENKTHPCLVPYDQLPAAQKTKDYLFRAVVHTAYKKTGE